MANIDEILKKETTNTGAISKLSNAGIDEKTNKNALILALVNAGVEGDVKAAIYLLENSEKEQPKEKPKTPLNEARKKLNEVQSKKRK